MQIRSRVYSLRRFFSPSLSWWIFKNKMVDGLRCDLEKRFFKTCLSKNSNFFGSAVYALFCVRKGTHEKYYLTMAYVYLKGSPTLDLYPESEMER